MSETSQSSMTAGEPAGGLRRVGRSRLSVGALGFGAAPLGDIRLSAGTCLDTVAAAWAGGVRFFDTAPWYGIGRSERRLGLALADCAAGEPFRLNTKVGRRLEPEPVVDDQLRTLAPGGGPRTPRDPASGHRVHFDYTEAGIVQQHRDSLTRLGLPRVDSLTLHDIDHGYHHADQVETALAQLDRHRGGGARALESLRAAGLIDAIGAGCNREMRNFASWDDGRHEDLIERIADSIALDFLVIAGPYTLLDTLALRRVLPLCEARGIGVIIASPFAGGWLVAPERVGYMYGQTPPEIAERTARLRAVAAHCEAPIAAAALQFALAHPAVAAVIPGARSAAEARAAAALLNTPVPADFWTALKTQGLLDDAAPTPA
jgi:D-threo-aldose 1-dehydrogenase